MKYLDYSVVFKEHPKYISIAIRITECPRHCPQCHSPELQEDTGYPFTLEVLKNIIVKYYGLFQNMIFMGGDHQEFEFVEMLKLCKEFNLKTTLWTGSDNVSDHIKLYLDYLKTGAYDHKLGGLDSPTTNQRYIEVITGKEIKC